MNRNTLLATQKILFINWVIAPALSIWIWIGKGFISAIFFFVVWLIADKIWDSLASFLITLIGRAGASDDEAFQMAMSDEVPMRVAYMMLIDLSGTFFLPWIVAGFFAL